MESDFPPFADCTIAILGLGLMGGSMAKALRGKCRAVIAVDPDRFTRDLARQFRIVDRVSENLKEIVPLADVIILAAPVKAILQMIPELRNLHPGSPIVIDIGSTKTVITRELAALPERFAVIGGHPMCGKETSGLGAADPDLFRGAPFALVPIRGQDSEEGGQMSRARAFALKLVKILGASPLWVDAETHDLWVAHTSHLPYLLSAALTLVTPEDAAPLIGPGFRSTSRLAGSHPKMMNDILATNRENILRALAKIRMVLEQIETDLEHADGSRAEELFAAVKNRREDLLHRANKSI